MSNNVMNIVCYYVTHEFQSEATLYSLPECQGTPCSKQVSYMKFKWQQVHNKFELDLKYWLISDEKKSQILVYVVVLIRSIQYGYIKLF